MAKRRKTRKDKKLADMRHNFTHSILNQAHFETKISIQPKTISQSLITKSVVTSSNAYPFLIKDLSKTAMLTLSILAFQIVLFFLLRNHIFVIPGLAY